MDRIIVRSSVAAGVTALIVSGILSLGAHSFAETSMTSTSDSASASSWNTNPINTMIPQEGGGFPGTPMQMMQNIGPMNTQQFPGMMPTAGFPGGGSGDGPPQGTGNGTQKMMLPTQPGMQLNSFGMQRPTSFPMSAGMQGGQNTNREMNGQGMSNGQGMMNGSSGMNGQGMFNSPGSMNGQGLFNGQSGMNGQGFMNGSNGMNGQGALNGSPVMNGNQDVSQMSDVQLQKMITRAGKMVTALEKSKKRNLDTFDKRMKTKETRAAAMLATITDATQKQAAQSQWDMMKETLLSQRDMIEQQYDDKISALQDQIDLLNAQLGTSDSTSSAQ